MQCTICHGSGPFTLEACVLDESKPMCDKCASAVDALSENEENYSEWEKSYCWLDSVKAGIQNKDVSAFICDILDAAKANPNYEKVEEKIMAKERAIRIAAETKHDAEVAPYNAKYEYAVESIPDNSDGSANTALIAAIISNYASKGWRLHKTMVNEIGRTSQSSGVGGFSTGTNATIEQTILVFERCVKPLSQVK